MRTEIKLGLKFVLDWERRKNDFSRLRPRVQIYSIYSHLTEPPDHTANDEGMDGNEDRYREDSWQETYETLVSTAGS